jgi:hypothetical protein
MSKFVNLPRTPDARYAIGAAMSCPVYGALYIAMLRLCTDATRQPQEFHGYFLMASSMRSKKYGAFGAMSWEAMLREVGHYAVAVVGLSAAIQIAIIEPTKVVRSAAGTASVPGALARRYAQLFSLGHCKPCLLRARANGIDTPEGATGVARELAIARTVVTFPVGWHGAVRGCGGDSAGGRRR